MVALVTPMYAGTRCDTELDFPALARLVEFHIENRTDAIIAVGTTGESATLSETEHCRVIQEVVERVAGRVPVIAGTGANSTTEALRLTREAKKLGADACLLVTPYYNKPTQEGLYQHHKTIADAVDIGQILYNVPSRTGCDMQPQTIARLAELPNIIGIKEASGELSRLAQLRLDCPSDFLLLCGEDALAQEFICQGGHGVISVVANVVPADMHQMCALARTRDTAAAKKIDKQLQGLHKSLFVESNPIPVKWALHRMGKIAPGIRLPLTWLSEHHAVNVEQAMHQAEIL